jgi:hypothetical protein
MLDPIFGAVSRHGPGPHPINEVAILLAASALLAAICWYRRQWLACALAAGIPIVAAAVWFSLLRVEGPILSYLLMWTGALTLLAGVALVVCVTSPGRPLLRALAGDGRTRLPGAVILAGCAVLSGWRLADGALRTNVDVAGWGSVTQASLAVERELPPQLHRVLVCVTSAAAWPVSAGVVANLRKDGRDARVNPQWLYVFGRELAPSGREQVAVFLGSTQLPPSSPRVKAQRYAADGGLAIWVFQPRQGFVSAAVCPQVR